jgi:hypothetical protein
MAESIYFSKLGCMIWEGFIICSQPSDILPQCP